MKPNNLLLKLLYRFLKEKGMFNSIIKSKLNIPLKIMSRYYIIYYDSYIRYICNMLQCSNDISYFYEDVNTNKEFNKIMYIICKPLILKFLNENNLIDKINYKIQHPERNVTDSYFHNLDEYLNYIFIEGISPMQIFECFYNLGRSDNDDLYWYNMNLRFKLYMRDYLTD